MKIDDKKLLAKRLLVYFVGLYLVGFSNAISKLTPLGLAPNSSLPNVISLIFNANLGVISAITFSCYVFIQWLILGKSFKKINFLQVPVSFVYGYFFDHAMKVVAGILPVPTSHTLQIVYTIISAFSLGFSIKIYLTPSIISLPPEGLCGSVSQRFNISFPNAKNICDILVVLTSIILSLVFFKGLNGVREGTIIHAVLVGRAVKLADKLFGKSLYKLVWGTDRSE